jgi:hypothetical protein
MGVSRGKTDPPGYAKKKPFAKVVVAAWFTKTA